MKNYGERELQQYCREAFGKLRGLRETQLIKKLYGLDGNFHEHCLNKMTMRSGLAWETKSS
ncbi:protein SUPPRESSOR OF GENE SILENCING 3-like protein [Iris pallida]|uniref:Protein SUPPRESSOR OF GENE SILENCING 3-like protein n=1 Tax=Iris pallida TaxID=29817 RepID=A0AAX6EPG6_IRIPA|nr:protein SUPPRESSOR OF GENE SILENCING 3-like protein [Iris pallida]